MNKAFLKAIGDIKKQKDNQPAKEEKPADKPENKDDDLSSSQQKRLKELGVHKKKIQKETDYRDNKWKHDRFGKEDNVTKKPKPLPNLNELALSFEDNPGYNKLYPLIKHIKIYVREINDSKVVFNTAEAFEQAKSIYTKNGFKFSSSKTNQGNISKPEA